MSQVGIKLNNLQAQISTLAAQSATNPLVSALNANGQNINNVGTLTSNTLTFGDGSSQNTANDVYSTGVTTGTVYPIACLGSASTGRTSLYTDSAGHIGYNPATNTITLSNSGKITLNGSGALLQNSGNTLTYRVPSTFKHSFEVVSGTEIAKIDSTGLSTNTIQRASDGELLIQNLGTSGSSIRLKALAGGVNLETGYGGLQLFTAGGGAGPPYFYITNDGTSGQLSMNAGSTASLPTITTNLLQHSTASDLEISNTGAGNIVHKAITGQKHSFQVNSVEITNIDTTGINVVATKALFLNGYAGVGTKISMNNTTAIFSIVNPSGNNEYETTASNLHTFNAGGSIMSIDSLRLYMYPSKTITLAGNSSTSTLEMSNTTGVLKLQNNSDSNSYEVPTSKFHSFKVNSVEKTKVDVDGITSSGLTIGTFNVPTGSLVTFNTTVINPYPTSFLLPTNALSLVYACIPQPTQTTGNWFALTVVTGSSVGAATYFYPIVSNNMTLGAIGTYFSIATPLANLNAQVRLNVIKLV